MRIRFQADADFNQVIIKAVLRREPGLDFQTAQTANFVGLKDPGVLALAAREQRLLITHDRKTMPIHFADFIQRETSWGVLIVPQSLSIRLAAEDLLLIWLATEAEEWMNRIQSLPLP